MTSDQDGVYPLSKKVAKLWFLIRAHFLAYSLKCVLVQRNLDKPVCQCTCAVFIVSQTCNIHVPCSTYILRDLILAVYTFYTVRPSSCRKILQYKI